MLVNAVDGHARCARLTRRDAEQVPKFTPEHRHRQQPVLSVGAAQGYSGEASTASNTGPPWAPGRGSIPSLTRPAAPSGEPMKPGRSNGHAGPPSGVAV